MFHQTGTFNGIDTCSATIFENPDLEYIIYAKSEARSIKNIPDINANLIKLRQENIISEYFESRKIAFVNPFSSSIDYLKYTKAATFVSLGKSMILQDKMTNRKIIVLLDRIESQSESLNFLKYWSACIYPFQI